MLDLEQINKEVQAILRHTAEDLLKYYGNIHADSESKDSNYTAGIVTELDRKTENFIREKLSEIYPVIGFRGEEVGDLNDGDSDELTWLVDPIDGTSHFVRGLPFFAPQ